jgi:hypothetical protein
MGFWFYILGQLIVPLLMVFIAHAVFLGIFQGKDWYKTIAYFIYCGLWSVYVYFLSNHGGLNHYFLLIDGLGCLVIGGVIFFLNRRSPEAE